MTLAIYGTTIQYHILPVSLLPISRLVSTPMYFLLVIALFSHNPADLLIIPAKYEPEMSLACGVQ